MPAADFLLIDLGNTTAKLRLARAASALLGKTRRLPTAALLAPDGADALRKTLSGWRYGRAVLSAVVPEAARIVTAALPGTLTVHGGLDTGVDLRGYPRRENTRLGPARQPGRGVGAARAGGR